MKEFIPDPLWWLLPAVLAALMYADYTHRMSENEEMSIYKYKVHFAGQRHSIGYTNGGIDEKGCIESTMGRKCGSFTLVNNHYYKTEF